MQLPDARRTLVVAPLRVARDTWPAEIRKWDHLRHLRVSVAVGTEAERKKAIQADADIYIINRENIPWLVEKMPFDFDTLVVDELSSFKNHQAKRFKALLGKRDSFTHIIGLTGTPCANGLMDLWAEYKILDGGERLGNFITPFRESYFVPDRWSGHVVYSYKPRAFAEKELYKKIEDITISMKSVDHLPMPERVSVEHPVYLSKPERARYDGIRKDMVLELPDGKITAASAGVLAGKLCQMANGAIYDETGATEHVHDRKLDALEDLVEASCGKPVLVAYWFKHDFARIQARFPSVEKLDSAESVARWNAQEIPVAAIHPASAGHGLNLQNGGSAIIWFGLTWSLELYQQTCARLWRQGQRNTVTIHHIITKGTIDEQVMAALSGKDRTQSALLDAVRASLTEERGDA